LESKVFVLRKIIAVAAVAALALSLVGCSSSAQKQTAAYDGVKSLCEPFNPGPVADQIKVTLHKNATPTVNFPTPLTAAKTQSAIVDAGTGPIFTGGEMLDFEYMGFNAATGKSFQSSKWNGTDFATQLIANPVDKTATNFCHALTGARQGSTVAIIFDSKEGHGNKPIAQLGINAHDSIVFVIKLLKVFLPRANGDAQLPKDGFPQVSLAPNGQPGLTMQDWSTSSAPKDFQAETLIKGRGAKVKLGQTVTVHYSGFVWSPTHNMFDSSWDKGTPAQFALKKGALIPGFIQAIEGQTVGSQVVAIMPPKDAYQNQATGSIPAGSTLIFVIDILGAN
jgi:FKBP-type peptidyl-prolyl cis-trans isomerase